MNQRRSTRVEINGWIVLDKPVGLPVHPGPAGGPERSD